MANGIEGGPLTGKLACVTKIFIPLCIIAQFTLSHKGQRYTIYNKFNENIISVYF